MSPIMDDEEFREDIKRRLKKAGIKRSQLSEESGYTVSSINNILSTKKLSDISKKALDTSLRNLERKQQDPENLDRLALYPTMEQLKKMKQAAALLSVSLQDFLEIAESYIEVLDSKSHKAAEESDAYDEE